MQISKRFLLIFFFGILVSTEIFASEGWQLTPVKDVSSPTSTPCCLGNITDDFSDGNLIPYWVPSTGCSPFLPYESGGKLVMDWPSGCPIDASVAVSLNSSLYQLCGDFDVQVDFEIVSMPSPPIATHWLEFYVFKPGQVFSIARDRAASTYSCRPYLNYYAANEWSTVPTECGSTTILTSDLVGKLRITRTGTTLSSYYWNGSSWVLARTGSTTTDAMYIGSYSGSGDGTGHIYTLDNLVVISQLPANSDADTVPDCRDNCPLVSNSNQSDVDSDTVGDSCDICPNYYNPLQEIIKPGDANASGTYTLADVIATVNYIFNKPGCSPQPLCWLSGLFCRGDWDGSTTISLSDVIRAVNYIFNKPGGPWDALSSGVCCL